MGQARTKQRRLPGAPTADSALDPKADFDCNDCPEATETPTTTAWDTSSVRRLPTDGQPRPDITMWADEGEIGRWFTAQLS